VVEFSTRRCQIGKNKETLRGLFVLDRVVYSRENFFMKKYYLSYTVNSKNPKKVFRILSATSIEHAYRTLCEIDKALIYREVPTSDEDALHRIRKGKECSLNFLFILPDEFQDLTVRKLIPIFAKISNDRFADHFVNSSQKIVRTGISHEYPAWKEIFRKAEQPLRDIGAMHRSFERRFLPNTWFIERTGP
jgi:hypothetical protein